MLFFMTASNTICINCGAPFYCAPARQRRGQGRFCSHKCHERNRTRIDPALRVWKHVDKRSEDECWNWTASIGSHGYGQLSIYPDAKRVKSAHVFSFEMAVSA